MTTFSLSQASRERGIEVTGQVVADCLGKIDCGSVVNLSGQPLRRHAEILASIAHPDVRPELRESLRHHFHLMPYRR